MKKAKLIILIVLVLFFILICFDKGNDDNIIYISDFLDKKDYQSTKNIIEKYNLIDKHTVLFSPVHDILETKKLTDLYKQGIAWGEAKELLFELLESKINPLRKNYQELIKDKQILEKTLISGAEKALDVSTPLINKIRKAVGIRGFTD